MYESRCGICCSTCERKDKVNCTGCVNMDKPYWGGQCGVKTCCEKKKIDHCGQCDSFPCEMLSTMGVEFGFDPLPRLEMCKKWISE